MNFVDHIIWCSWTKHLHRKTAIKLWFYYGIDCTLSSCHVRASELIYTLQLPDCQEMSGSKQAWYLKFKWQQRNSNPKPLKLKNDTQSVWLNGILLNLFSAQILFLICYKTFTLHNYLTFRISRENLIKVTLMQIWKSPYMFILI